MVESGRTVVIDTNFVGGRTFRAEAFDRLVARLVARGHSVVIPEVVVWEWAQPSHDALTAAQSELARASSAVDDVLDVMVPDLNVPPVEAIADRIRAHIDKGSATVAATDGDGAVEAIANK